MGQLKLDLPPELVELLRELGEPPAAVKECVVLELYRRGLISSGKAAELLEMNRMEFIRYSGRLGVPFFRMSAEEWNEERQRLKELNDK
jgi:predicted HTH domain antitoxin